MLRNIVNIFLFSKEREWKKEETKQERKRKANEKKNKIFTHSHEVPSRFHPIHEIVNIFQKSKIKIKIKINEKLLFFH